MEVNIQDAILAAAAEEGMDAFVEAIVGAIDDAINGELTADTMSKLNADQITLLAYKILRDEVMEGGFVQLIHNGYGAFIYKNPFAKAMREWGIDGLAQLISRSHKFYTKYHEQIERDMTDDEFMAMFEQCPEFDDFDDEFVINEEGWTNLVACYLDENLDRFVRPTQILPGGGVSNT